MNNENAFDYNDDDFEFEDDFAGTELTGKTKDDLESFHNNTLKTSELFDPNFETELGSSSKIFTDQDIIDQEFSDMAKLDIVQTSGDDKFGKKVIIFYACRLPPVNTIDQTRLLDYTMKTMKQFVSTDYSLIYFHHGLTNKNNPGIKFLLNAYKLIDRDFKKNLKNIFIVHPTTLLRVIIDALLPLFSQKAKKKLIKIRRLKDLDSQFYLDQMVIPEVIQTYDKSKVVKDLRVHSWHFTDVKLSNYDSKMNSPESENRTFNSSGDLQSSRTHFYDDVPNPQFGVTLQQIRHMYPTHSLPPVMEQCMEYLRKECLESEGLFRRCTAKPLLEEVQRKFNRDEFVDLEKYADPHLTASLLKTFLRSLKEPLMTFDLHDDIIKIHSCKTDEAVEHIRQLVILSLPDYNYHVLKSLVEFLKEVAELSDKNKMTLQNIANVFAPSLAWSRNESSIAMIHIIIKFTYLLLVHSETIFVKKDTYPF